ncbi:MAG: sigma 54-interacting transcriptional regulator [Clostridia bacterium]
MIKILVVAPYDKFAELFKTVFAEHNEKVYKDNEKQEEYKLDIVVEYDQSKIKDMEMNCDVVIARGFSAILIKNRERFIPVIEIPVTPNDVIRCLNESKERFSNKKVIFFGTKPLVSQSENLSDLLNMDIETIEMPSTMGREPELAFSKIKEKDYVAIGGKPICEYGEKLGIPCIMIESGRESIRTAISDAKRAAYIRREEEKKAQKFKTILDYNVDGIIAFDHINKFTSMNAMAENILGISAEDAIGKSLDDLFAYTEFSNFLYYTDRCSDELVKLNNIPLVVNKTGIFLKNERIGSVVTLQYLSKIQNSEWKIRNKITEKGHVAKYHFYDILGESHQIKSVIRRAQKFSEVDSNILIFGQSGTGKELFAQSIHNTSKRKKFPFVAINCAAIPENLLESELFGYVEGAFTGATKGGKQGLIELAHMGTLFLDEISEMPMSLQGRLLRVLQEKELMRLGHDRIIHVDIRVISATNKDLLSMVEEGKFREDLYYRLDVLKLKLPSLEERKEDILLLAEVFLEKYAEKCRKSGLALTNDAKLILKKMLWRGNIRELKNTCECLAVLCESSQIDKQDVESILKEKIQRFALKEISSAAKDKKELQPPDFPVTKETVECLLEKGKTRVQIANMLEIDRTTLWRKMKMWGLLQK